MSFIHIKKTRIEQLEGWIEAFAVPAMSIQSPQGKKLIPNPLGHEACLFQTLEESIEATHRAGFDALYEGRKFYRPEKAAEVRPKPSSSRSPSAPTALNEAVPILIQRLQDREPTVIANAAVALGELRAHTAVSAMIGILGHEDPNVRKAVAEALSKLGDSALPSLKAAYQQALISQDKQASYIRLTVMSAYLSYTYTHRELLPELLPQVVDALNDDSWLVRAQAALVLAQSAQYYRDDASE
ncbi:MAG: HEAT repeat domain-containing protein [Cyanobacteria bacterium]|nr:HEAT repeat domain-containing protein [Cyanobacteriota bacterium]